MRKSLALLLSLILSFSMFTNIYAQDIETNDILSIREISSEEIPQDIVPLKFNNIEEFEQYMYDTLRSYDNIVKIEGDTIFVEGNTAVASDNSPIQLYGLVGPYTSTHTQRVDGYNLFSDVNYTYYYDMYTKEFGRVNWHDVYPKGLGAFSRWIGSGQSADISSNRTSIDVQVRGVMEVYASIPFTDITASYRVIYNYSIR